MIIPTNKFIEIKSDWTYRKDYESGKIPASFQMMKEKGYNFKIIVYSPKGEVLHTVKKEKHLKEVYKKLKGHYCTEIDDDYDL